MGRNARRDARAADADAFGEAERHCHADGDRLAMQEPLAEARRRFQRVAEGMAEIEQRANPRLGLVGSDNAALARQLSSTAWARASRSPAKRRWRCLRARQRMPHHRSDRICHLGVAGGKLAPRQCVEHGGVGDHRNG
jgi:hypothetical protein